MALFCALAIGTQTCRSGGLTFPPPEATVVLLVGLPGDVESESKYRDEEAQWLQWLQHADPTPRQLIVFSHEKPLFESTSAVSKFEWHPATRDAFLAWSQSLAGQTNPLVVVVWGHGGLRRSEPVFHVRGPRLTVADFKSLHDRAQRPSQWILMFRGSGRFAETLVRPGCEILSSERASMFQSDPVGLPLVLKALREKTFSSFAALAQEVGRLTDAWYEERKLTRLEDPTFWTEKEVRSLVLAARDPTLASATPSESPPISNSLPAPRRVTERGGDWKEISPVQPIDYPGDDAILLRHSARYTLGDEPAVSVEQDSFIQVLTWEGRSFGDFDYTYSPPGEDLEFLDCEVLQPDGTLLRLDPDEIREGGSEVAEYDTERHKFFSLPGVVPGAILRVRHRSQWQRYPMPHVSLEIPLAYEIPVAELKVEIRLAKDSAMHFGFQRSPAIDPEIRQTAYGTSYHWSLRNVPADDDDVLSPPSGGASLLVSTFPDWKSFGDWYARISKLTDEITPELAATAQKVTEGATTDREKTVALYNYVTGLRYVSVPLGVNSYRPHAAANVLKNQFGDCKDKANLFNTLLHAVGIEAHLVLVPRFAQAYDHLPGFAFNHAISRVRIDGDFLWADTTDDVCRFGMLPPGDPGRKVLVMDGTPAALTPLPAPLPGEHQLTLVAKVNCSDLAATSIDLEVDTRGYMDYDLRAAAQELPSRRSRQPVLDQRFRPTAGAYALSTQSFTPISDLETNFSWRATGRAWGLATAQGNRTHLQACFWLPRDWDEALHARSQPLFLNEGYPLLLNERCEFHLPGTTADLVLPEAARNETGPLRWSVRWIRETDLEVTTEFTLELTSGELTQAETTLFQDQLSRLVAVLQQRASFSRGPPR